MHRWCDFLTVRTRTELVANKDRWPHIAAMDPERMKVGEDLTTMDSMRAKAMSRSG